jgi:transcription elongation factor GreA
MADRVPMSPRGHAQLESELKRLKTVDRQQIVKEIEIARAHGDISENAEFEAAKERQAHIEGRIRTIEDRLARAQVIDTTGQAPDAVRFGATVLLTDVETGEEITYTLVGEDESDAAQGMISVTSPVGRALIGKPVDEVVRVQVPRGTREFEIREIRFD